MSLYDCPKYVFLGKEKQVDFLRGIMGSFQIASGHERYHTMLDDLRETLGVSLLSSGKLRGLRRNAWAGSVARFVQVEEQC